jgi:hypothetical protein
LARAVVGRVGARVPAKRVDARAVAQRIVARAAVDHVIAGPSVHDVVAAASVEPVVAAGARQPVVAGAAVEHVKAPLAVQDVRGLVQPATVEMIVAVAPHQQVGTAPTVERVTGGVPDEPGRSRAPGEQLDVGLDEVTLACCAVIPDAVERDVERPQAHLVGDAVTSGSAAQRVRSVLRGRLHDRRQRYGAVAKDPGAGRDDRAAGKAVVTDSPIHDVVAEVHARELVTLKLHQGDPAELIVPRVSP